MPGPIETRAFLSLGGNIGNPRHSMAEALRAVDADRHTRLVRVSSLYKTPPWGMADQPDFLNCAAEICTGRSARELLDLCLSIEQAHKRVRRERWGPRTVDLDILAYGDVELAEPGLAIPHPRMLERAFVLVPLAEIAPQLVLSGKAVSSHLAKVETIGISRQDTAANWWSEV